MIKVGAMVGDALGSLESTKLKVVLTLLLLLLLDLDITTPPMVKMSMTINMAPSTIYFVMVLNGILLLPLP